MISKLVKEFHETFGAPIREHPDFRALHDRDLNDMRLALILEEADELFVALKTYNYVGTADALGDLLYVTYGAALSFGIPLDAVVAEIHRSNMTKLGADGKPIYREDGKVLKGQNYTPPCLAPLLNIT